MYHLRLFGTPTLELDDVALTGRPVQRHRLALLALLALAPGRRLTRDKLIAYLWPERDAGNGRNLLKVATHVLRGELGDKAVISDNDGLRLNEQVIEPDVTAFQTAITELDYERAVGLYRGPLLDGFFLSDAPEFEQWIEQERARLAVLYRGALEKLAASAETVGDLPTAVNWWKKCAAHDPYDTRVALRLINVLVDSGNRAAALQHAVIHERLLHEEFGIDTPAEIATIVEQLRQASQMAAVTVVDGPEVVEGVPAARRPDSRQRRLIMAMLALMLIGAIAAGVVLRGEQPHSLVNEDSAAPAIAVLPFDVQVEGGEVWREGLADLLATNLDGVAGLRAIDMRTIHAKSRAAGADSISPDRQSALEVAAASGARYALLGSMIGSRARLRIALRVYSVDRGRTVLRTHIDGSADSIFSLVDRLSIQVLSDLSAQRDMPDVRVTRVTTTSLPALIAYLEGEALARRGRYQQATARYQQAIDRDSTFALAWFGLAIATGWTGDLAVAAEAARRAAQGAGTLPERDRLLLRAFHLSNLGTAESLEVATRVTARYPDDALGWYLLGELLFHGSGPLLVDMHEAELAFARASQLDPDFPAPRIHPIHNALRAGLERPRIDSMISEYEKRAPGTATALEVRMAERLIFAAPATRDSLIRELPTALPESYLPFFAHENLSHPGQLDTKVRVLKLARDRASLAESISAAQLLVVTLLAGGRLGDALAALEHPRMKGRGFDRLYLARLAGIPVPERRIDEQLAMAAALGRDSVGYHFFAGALALERGQNEQVTRTLRALRKHQRSAVTAHDTTAANFAGGAAAGIHGYQSLLSGKLPEAEKLLNEARLTTVGGASPHPINIAIRWWLADAALRQGQRERAAVLYQSIADAPFASEPGAVLQLARISEALGRRDLALALYAWCTTAWRSADAGARHLLAEARAGVTRLSTRPSGN